MAQIIDMPKLSDTMTVGTLVKWLKKEGDVVKSGDMLAEVETDKATMELESFFDGTLLKVFVPAGSQVAIGEALCAVGKPGETVNAPEKKSPAPAAAPTSPKEEAKPEAPPTGTATKNETEARPAATPAGPGPASSRSPTAQASSAPVTRPAGERIKISPLARKLAAELKVDPANVAGSGPGGRIVRADIEAYSKNPKPVSKAGGSAAAPSLGAIPSTFVGTSDVPIQEEKTITLSNMRSAIARRLVESKTTIPHFYLEVEIDAAPLLELRQQLINAFGDGAKISVNDIILKGCAHALRRVPQVNSSWQGTTVQQHAAAHVSFAVAIEDGLITPVIFNAHAKSVYQIGAEARALGAKAKAKKLQPNEFTGGTFCVSNLGMMGVERFSAIINPPNAAILAVGTTVKKPVVNAAGEIVVGQRLSLTLSCDHRIVDGATGAQFLAALKEILEKPLQILA